MSLCPSHPSLPAGLGSEAGLGTPPDLGALRCLNPGLSAASIQMGTGAPAPKCPRTEVMRGSVLCAGPWEVGDDE